ncbi:MAG: hypothetical protein FWF05_01725 [Oscillospiraceae bacterium]|nr:hypothetical protein [Oscillospiraceae bacterium]
MSKKFLAVILALVTLLSVCTVFAFAEYADDPVTYTYWQPDADFHTFKTMAAGNAQATLLRPGDKIYVRYSSLPNGNNLVVRYLADADNNVVGNWQVANKDMLAFSMAGANTTNLTDTVTAANFRNPALYDPIFTYTVKDLGDTLSTNYKIDFTIAYPDDNAFLGWVVKSGTGTSALTLELCAVWDKQKIPENLGGGDKDVEDILDIKTTLFGRIMAPFMAVWKSWQNGVNNILQSIVDVQLGNDPSEPQDIGTWQAFTASVSRTLDIIFNWLDTWANPLVKLFQSNDSPAEEPAPEPVTEQPETP